MAHRLFFACFLLLSYSSCQPARTPPYSVAFYNCENFFNPENDPGKDDDEFTSTGKYQYDNRKFELKLHHISVVLQAIYENDSFPPPCLVGLCEVEDTVVLARLLQQPELTRKQLAYIFIPGNDPRGINTALLFDPARFRPLASENLSVPSNDTLKPLRPILYVRGILGSDTTHIFVNHWPSQRNDDAVATHQIVADILNRAISRINANNREAAIIIMGDFNENPDDNSMAQLSAPGLSMINLFRGCDTSFGTEYFGERWNVFDQILVSNRMISRVHQQGCATDGVIFCPDFLQNHAQGHEGEPLRFFTFGGRTGYSDHYPVVVTCKPRVPFR